RPKRSNHFLAIRFAALTGILRIACLCAWPVRGEARGSSPPHSSATALQRSKFPGLPNHPFAVRREGRGRRAAADRDRSDRTTTRRRGSLRSSASYDGWVGGTVVRGERRNGIRCWRQIPRGTEPGSCTPYASGQARGG